MAAETARILRELPKGDALATAQLAGIMAAKRTSELIPLCHPLPLSHVEVTLTVGDESVEIVASAETTAQTGVEMEALTAASVAALTVYDMAKAIDKGMRIVEVALVEKTKEPVGLKAAVLTVSDGVVAGTREDRAATRSRSCCAADGYEVERRVVPDERDQIAAAIRELAAGARLVLTTGGTGLAPRDVTPEATRDVLDREAPGIAQALRADSIAKTPHGLLSRGTAGVVRLDARRQSPRLAGRLPRRLRGAAAGARARARASRRRPDRARADVTAVGLTPLPARFARLVKIEHTVFALPFAYVGAFLAVNGTPSAHDLFWITVAMVGARSLAMALNRLIDARDRRDGTRAPPAARSRADSFRPRRSGSSAPPRSRSSSSPSGS